MARIDAVKGYHPAKRFGPRGVRIRAVGLHHYFCYILIELLPSLSKMHKKLSALSRKQRVQQRTNIEHWFDTASRFDEITTVSSLITTPGLG
jgi:hypothetical protein